MAARALRTPSGLRKGKMPSSISSNASAIHRSCHIARSGQGGLPGGFLHVFEEIRARVHDQDVFFRPEAFLVGAETAIQRIEFRRAPVGRAIQRRGPGIALAAHPLGLAVGLGQEHLALALGVGANLLRRLRALRAQLVRDARAFRLHALIHRLADLIRQVHALDAHVHHHDAEFARLAVGVFGQDLHDLGAVGGYDLLHLALAEFIAQAAVDDLFQAPPGVQFLAADRKIILERVFDTPFDEGIHHHVFLFLGEERLRLRVQGQDARIEIARLVEERSLEVDPREVVIAQYLTKPDDDDLFALVHQVNGGLHRDQYQQNDAQQREQFGLVHGVVPRVRRSARPRLEAPPFAAAAAVASASVRGGTNGAAAAASPIGTSLSSGRYIRLLPAFWSMKIVVVRDNTCSMVSRYRRSRVTPGAFTYSLAI